MTEERVRRNRFCQARRLGAFLSSIPLPSVAPVQPPVSRLPFVLWSTVGQEEEVAVAAATAEKGKGKGKWRPKLADFS